MNVGFQGEPGAFSESAIHALLGPVATQGYGTFDDLLAAVDGGRVTHGLLPCENSIAGVIADAWTALAHYPRVHVINQSTHRIEQCLIGLPDSTLADLRYVTSHPVALAQCKNFFARHPHLAIESAQDTAGSVRTLVERGDPAWGAVGPASAARRYGARVLRDGRSGRNREHDAISSRSSLIQRCM